MGEAKTKGSGESDRGVCDSDLPGSVPEPPVVLVEDRNVSCDFRTPHTQVRVGCRAGLRRGLVRKGLRPSSPSRVLGPEVRASDSTLPSARQERRQGFLESLGFPP